MKKYLVILCSFLMLSFISLAATSSKGEQIQNKGSQEKKIIKSIEVRNNREIPTSVIKSRLTSKEGTTFSPENVLVDYERLIKDDAIETVSIFPQQVSGGVRLVVDITEKRDANKILQKRGITPNTDQIIKGQYVDVDKVRIKGLKTLKEREFLNMLSVKSGGKVTQNRLENDLRTLYETGKFRRILGYDLSDNEKGGVDLVFFVEENPILRGIKITGNTVFTDDELKAVMTTRTGEPFSANTVIADRDRILKKYYDDGYVLAEIVDIDVTSNSQLKFVITEGMVKEVGFKKMITKDRGQRRNPTNDSLKTRDFVVQREIELEPNKVFNIRDFDRTSSNLMRTGLFRNVQYEANTIPGKNNEKSIVILLEEERTASLQGAVSYGTEVGLLGMVALKDDNWDGRNQDVGFQYEKSDDGFSSFTVSFYDPWIQGTERLSWGWDLYKQKTRDSNSFLFHEIERYGFKLNAGKGLSRNVRIGIGTKTEYIIEENEKGRTTDEYLQNSIYPFITYDTRNNPINPTSGLFGRFQIEGGYASGHNPGPFGNITAEGRTYHRGFAKNNTMAYRLTAGIMSDSTKESQTFWVGGSSLRGYDGGMFKGREKLTLTVENRTQINDIIGFVVFSDVGRAWNQKPKDIYPHDRDFPEQIATTAGVGVRLNTPLGPLRFDFGWPVGEKIGDDKGMKFYFHMGQSF